MVLTGNKANNKAKRLASINHTTRKCHHHYNFSKYAVPSAIKQVFHQISVSPKDKDVLRFLWRIKQ